MLPRDLKVANFNLRDMVKRLTVQANAACNLPLSYIQYYNFVHYAAVVGGGGGLQVLACRHSSYSKVGR
jgi:hypothetical protein